MKRMIIALTTLLVAACAPAAPTEPPGPPELDAVTLPLADQAGNRMEALTQNGARWCTEDNVWCVEGAAVTATFASGAPAVTLPAEGEIWPVIVRSGESALQMYSGGGGRAQHLTLYDVAGGAAREVARMPLSGSADIRACFDEADERQRAGACRDEYQFISRLLIDETVASGPPVLILETEAGSYPGRVTRTADSLEQPPLTDADLVWAQDESCTFRRTYTRGADGLYAPNEPLPGCSDYLEP
jgi:hypothetical protein